MTKFTGGEPPTNTHATCFNIKVDVTNINRFGHAEWQLQTKKLQGVLPYHYWLAPHMTIAGKTNMYHLLYKGGSRNSKLRHISHYVLHSDIFWIVAVICVYWWPWCNSTYPCKPSMHRQIPHAWGSLGWWFIKYRSLVYTMLQPPPLSDQFGIPTGT